MINDYVETFDTKEIIIKTEIYLKPLPHIIKWIKLEYRKFELTEKLILKFPEKKIKYVPLIKNYKSYGFKSYNIINIIERYMLHGLEGKYDCYSIIKHENKLKIDDIINIIEEIYFFENNKKYKIKKFFFTLGTSTQKLKIKKEILSDLTKKGLEQAPINIKLAHEQLKEELEKMKNTTKKPHIKKSDNSTKSTKPKKSVRKVIKKSDKL